MKASKHIRYQSWLVCLSSSLVFFNDFLQMSFFGVLAPFLIKYYDLNALEFGQLSSIYFYATAFFIIPAGIILDKFSIRKIFLIITLTYVICPLLYIVFTNLFILYIGRILSGIAGSFCLIGSIALAKRWFPKNELGFVIGTIIVVGMSGGFFAQVPFAYLISVWGWKVALFYSSFLAIFAFLVVSLFVLNAPITPILSEKKPKNSSLSQSLIFILKLKPLWILGLCAGVLNIPLSLLATTWGNLYFLQTSHLSQSETALVVSMIFIGMLTGSPVVGYVLDYIKNINKLLLMSGFSSCLLILFSMQNKNFYFLVIVFFLLGLSCSCHTVIYSFIAREIPTSIVGLAEGFVSSMVMIIGPVYQIAYGYLLECLWNGIYEDGVKYYSSQSHHLALSFICVTLIACIIISEVYGKRYRHVDFKLKEYL